MTCSESEQSLYISQYVQSVSQAVNQSGSQLGSDAVNQSSSQGVKVEFQQRFLERRFVQGEEFPQW